MRYLSPILITLLLFTASSLSYAQCGAPVPMLCDADGDRDVDSDDIAAIALARGTPSSGPGDIRDMDGDGMITVLDARQCVAMCDEAQCEDPTETPPDIAWSESPLSVEAINGTVVFRSIRFTPDKGINEPSFRIEDHCEEQGTCSSRPKLDELVEITPLKSGAAVANEEFEINIAINIPTTTADGEYSGTLYVYDQQSEIALPLILNLLVESGSAFDIPEGIPLPTDDRIAFDDETDRRYIVDEAAVALVEGGDVLELQSKVSELGGILIGSITGLDIYQIRFTNAGQDLDSIIAQLAGSPIIEAASRIWEVDTFVYPDNGNDPEIPWLQSSVPNPQAVYEYINLPQAWDITTGSSQVNIGVIDGAFDLYHEDLQARIGAAAGDGINHHGTGVAGVIGAIGNNNVGIAGAMWFSNLQVLGMRNPNFLSTTSYMHDSANAGARIINISQGDTSTDELARIIKESFYKRAINQHPNVLFVMAAGNGPGDVRYTVPARLAGSYDNVISVTAINAAAWTRSQGVYDVQDYTPVRNILTNTGDVSVAAPGCVLTTGNNSTYKPECGSSFSAPLVSGVAGLALSVNSGLTAAELKRLIVNGACAGGKDVQNLSSPVIYVLDAYQSVMHANDPSALDNACTLTGLPIASDNTVTVDGKEWAQPGLFTNLSWNDINAVCPAGVCTGNLNGYDVNGWKWASTNDMYDLFNHYFGTNILGSGVENYSEDGSTWGPAFYADGWRYTANVASTVTNGWTYGEAPSNLATRAYLANGPTTDYVITGGGSSNFDERDQYIGAWFYRHTEISAADIVTVEGREWAQPDLFTNLSWNDINTVCPAGVCNGTLDGYDVTGWTWASVNDVNAMFNYFIGYSALGPGPDLHKEACSTWAPLFFDNRFRATLVNNGKSVIASTADTITVNGDEVRTYTPIFYDGDNCAFEDWANTVAQLCTPNSSSCPGPWLYR